jgi:hypothetical protein
MVDYPKYREIIIGKLQPLGFTVNSDYSDAEDEEEDYYHLPLTLKIDGTPNEVGISFEYDPGPYATVELENQWIDTIQENISVDSDPFFWRYIIKLTSILAREHDIMQMKKRQYIPQADAYEYSIFRLKEMKMDLCPSVSTNLSTVYYRRYQHEKGIWISLKFSEQTSDTVGSFIKEDGKHYILDGVELRNHVGVIYMPIKLDCQPYFWVCVWHICEMLAEPEPEPEPNGHATWP